MKLSPIDLQISDDCAEFYDDPLGWVMWAFPWSEPGTPLENFDGPDTWQIQILTEFGEDIRNRAFDGHTPVDPIQSAVASGHGIGKSALTAWLTLFIMSTRENSKGVVTANTSDQLRTKTWGELAKWKKLCITGHWFEYNNGKGNMNIYHLSNCEGWRVDAQTCREENSESFAGLHNAASTPWYLFDEASAVPDKIWEVAEGGKTDGEPIHFVFGNPTKNSGKFFECFHKNKHRWRTMQVDSRNAKMTNKKQIAKWCDDWGEDSDFFRVRVLGRFPKAGDMQFIPGDVVRDAMKRSAIFLEDDALIAGVDVARGGEDSNIVQFRRGFDAKSDLAYRIPGEKSRDSMQLISKLTDIFERHKPDAIFVDETGLGGPIADRLVQMGYNAIGVHFGGKAADEKRYINRAAEMWARMRTWLMNGGAIKDNPEIESDLTNREYGHDPKDRLKLESKDDMKKRGLGSPDWADALGLTFAQPVQPIKRVINSRTLTERGYVKKKVAYDPFRNL